MATEILNQLWDFCPASWVVKKNSDSPVYVEGVPHQGI